MTKQLRAGDDSLRSESLIGCERQKCAADSAGFTLIELVSVLTLVGILVALVVPAIDSSLNHFHRRFLYDETVTALRYARNRAVAKQCTFGVLLGNKVADNFVLGILQGETNGFAVVTASLATDNNAGGVCVTLNLNDLTSVVPRPYSKEPEVNNTIVTKPFFNDNSRDISMTNIIIGFDSLGQPIIGNQRAAANQTVCVGGRAIIVHAFSGLIETPVTACNA